MIFQQQSDQLFYSFLLDYDPFKKADAGTGHTSETHDGKQEFAVPLFVFCPLQPRQIEQGLDVCTQLGLVGDTLSCPEHCPEIQGSGSSSASATGSWVTLGKNSLLFSSSQTLFTLNLAMRPMMPNSRTNVMDEKVSKEPPVHYRSRG